MQYNMTKKKLYSFYELILIFALILFMTNVFCQNDLNFGKKKVINVNAYFNYRWSKVIDRVFISMNKKPIFLSITIARIKAFKKNPLWNFTKNKRKKIFKLFFLKLGFCFLKKNNIMGE